MPHRGLSDFWLLGAKVKDATLVRYKAAVRDFVAWCDQHGIKARQNDDVDEVFADYIHDCYELNNGAGRTKVAYAMAGMQLLAPPLRGKLPISAQCLLGWKKRHPGQRHPPLTWHITVAIAAQLAVWGHCDMAIGAMLAFASLLRIGELVGLHVSDFLDANADDPRVDFATRSGFRLRSTKTAANLFAELHNDDIRQLVRLLVNGKRSEDRIFAFSASSFRGWFKRAVCALGLDSSYVPHSLRHGGATALYMAGLPIETILHRGRWASTKSARYYVQSGEALLLAQRPVQRVRDVGRSAANALVAVFTAWRGRFHAAVKAASRGQKRRCVRFVPPVQPRHSSRHDWQVRPDYIGLDEGNARPSW